MNGVEDEGGGKDCRRKTLSEESTEESTEARWGRAGGRALPLVSARQIARRQLDVGAVGVGAALAVEAEAGGEVDELVVPGQAAGTTGVQVDI